MKALKGSLVALVAILAVSLTVAMQAGAFDSKAVRAGECYTQAVIGKSALCQPINLNQTLSCISTDITDVVYSLGSTTVIDPATNCPGGAKFCCLEVRLVASALCDDQSPIDPAGAPVSGFYQVQQVRCFVGN